MQQMPEHDAVQAVTYQTRRQKRRIVEADFEEPRIQHHHEELEDLGPYESLPPLRPRQAGRPGRTTELRCTLMFKS